MPFLSRTATPAGTRGTSAQPHTRPARLRFLQPLSTHAATPPHRPLLIRCCAQPFAPAHDRAMRGRPPAGAPGRGLGGASFRRLCRAQPLGRVGMVHTEAVLHHPPTHTHTNTHTSHAPPHREAHTPRGHPSAAQPPRRDCTAPTSPPPPICPSPPACHQKRSGFSPTAGGRDVRVSRQAPATTPLRASHPPTRGTPQSIHAPHPHFCGACDTQLESIAVSPHM